MKTRVLLVLAAFFLVGNTFAQKKNVKKQSALKAQQQMEEIVTSKNFEFVANTVLSMSMSPKDLVGNNYTMTFSPEKIVSALPYFGEARRGGLFSKDKGMNFEGTPEDYEIKSDFKEHQVSAKVVTDSDTYEISMVIGSSGYATLTISSKNRDTITYRGEIVAVEP